MSNEILFAEKQRFNQWWLWLLLLVLNGVFVFGIYKQLIIGVPFGNNPTSNNGLCLTTIFVLALTILLLNFRLDTQIKNDGIYVRFFPLHVKYKHYTWEQLSKVYMRNYSPISEFGGWGIRYGKTGDAYNIAGNKGLQLEFSNGKKLLIGTNKTEEISATLCKMNKLI